MNIKINLLKRKGLEIKTNSNSIDISITKTKGIRFNKINDKFVDLSTFYLIYFLTKFNGTLITFEVNQFSIEELYELKEKEFNDNFKIDIILNLIKRGD